MADDSGAVTVAADVTIIQQRRTIDSPGTALWLVYAHHCDIIQVNENNDGKITRPVISPKHTNTYKHQSINFSSRLREMVHGVGSRY